MIREIIRKVFKKQKKYTEITKNGVRLASAGYIEGNVEIGFGTYINSGYRIVSGANSSVKIGKYCAIGRNFGAASRTHDLTRPTADENNDMHLVKESSILIGRCVWIGDNVLIKEGIEIGDYAIVGANSVVVNDVKKFEIVGGNPAKHIKYNTQHYKYDDN